VVSSGPDRDGRPLRGGAQIVALLAERRARVRLQEALGADHRIAFVRCWSDLHECVRSLPVVLAVVDPREGSMWQVDALERLVQHHPSLRIVLYLPFRPDVAGPLLRWARLGVREHVFLDLGDTSLYLRERVERALAGSTPERVYLRLRAALDPISEEWAEALRVALVHGTEIDSVQAWAEAMGRSTASFYRFFRAQGLPTPRRCLEWIRFLYAVKRLEDPGYAWEDVVQGPPPTLPSSPDGARKRELRYTVSFEIALAQFVQECRAHVARSQVEVGG
jgi:hypothetical protein